ncbi:MAG: vitamin B12-dependent ribonucleotide reductase, partial [Cytophagales bacterium]|nr:vitamin B12-dependent ribonucleotide reductase [Armatimonadota bacterium]
MFAGEGLTFERRYTKAGEDVYATTEWDLRTAAITGERGEVVFEQKDCEIPKAWSMLATNVVVSKYFRGKVGAPGREHSVKQLISRVADTIHKWGKKDNYFATEADADAFHDELRYLLLHQYMAFNSPVWFNLGVPGERPQVSACFINSVDDTMESILTLAKTEGMLFKWGSGTGTNLSVLRSSKEGLKGGGTASGPVSFMRGFDAFAGAIKSGGKTRRAAKMVILNADHPDIEEFVECKADAEKKAHSLIEAGYSGAFNVPNGAYDSVFFQNANHSVRATDDFMRAVELDRDWSTINVIGGEVAETKRARDLMHKIAQATWFCGDPGMQFDTTANRWHTCPNTNRINASNPCSEFFFLDDTACNLASLNLMRFRTSDREFDIEEFKHAVRITITAQEIMVGNAAYPTDKITVNSFDYRPLGLGYANLGALLMARGLAYDSDEGRAYAAAITAILSGEAYHQSSKMAGRVGTFAGYERNRQPMLRVMQMHRDHIEAIQRDLVPDNLIDAARQCWDRALAAGQETGYRNSQISVLAPTGCLVAGSMVLTDRGLMRLSRLGDVNGKQWQDTDFRVLTDEGPKQVTKFYVNGIELTRRILTRSGYAIQGTLKHRIKVVDTATGEMVWKRFADITPGDVVALSMGTLVGEPCPVQLPPLGEERWTGDYATRAPRTMTPELAELIGYFMGDGSLQSKGPRFCVANTDADVAARVQSLVKDLFNLPAHVTEQGGYQEVAVHSVPLSLWWDACGFAKRLPGEAHTGKGYLPHIPDAVLATNDAVVYGAFLRGLYEADGTVTNGVPCWTTTHQAFSEEVKTLLLALGIPTMTRQTVTGWDNSPAYVLRLRNSSYADAYRDAVGFIGARKTALVANRYGEQTARHDFIYLGREVVDELISADHPLRGAATQAMRRQDGAITRRTAQSLFEETGDRRLAHALGFFYDRITANEDGGEQLTYDLSVPENVTYIAQGFISHNTIGFLMDCDTTGVEPDIAIVKYKSLVGGGMFKIVNQTVPEALERLGYSASERKAILDYIEANDTIEGAPGLADEHLSVFDCAFRAKNGTRTIHYLGHIKMMAAVQPFISGAISKTVNMPHDATPEEIAEAYLQAWKLGTKALAIYRDGSKKTQPLSTGATETKKEAVAVAAAAAPLEARPLRRKLPDERQSLTHKFSVGGHEGYITIGLYPDQTPGEIFITMSKEGSVVSGLMDSFATSISLALQYGVPLRTLVEKFMHTRFEPSGFTGNPDIPMAKSIMDYLFRYVALKFLDKDERAHVGLIADQQDEYDNEGAAAAIAA